jgi:riboflavin kinase
MVLKDRIKPDKDEYFTLKILAKVMKEKGSIRLSSSELGILLNASQQTASRLILKLETSEFIQREIAGKKQNIILKETALNALYDEMAELSNILGISDQVKIYGTVASGLGEGRYYVSKKPYVIEFDQKLGITPYPGTLNIKIDSLEEPKLRMLRANEGILIKGFETDDRTYGDVKAFSCSLRGKKCAAIFPYRSVYKDVIEIISNDYLRESLNLHDGDRVGIEFDLRN